MKGSYRPNDVQIEYNMLCNSNDTRYNVFRNLENGLFCIHTFNHKFFFFFQLYNSLWVLACSFISFYCLLSCVLFFQLVTSICLKSFLTSSSHLTLGPPFSLVAYVFHLYMVLATLSLVILSTCSNQLSSLYFMCFTIFSLLIAFSSSSFVLSLHSSLAFCVGPNILLNINHKLRDNFGRKSTI